MLASATEPPTQRTPTAHDWHTRRVPRLHALQGTDLVLEEWVPTATEGHGPARCPNRGCDLPSRRYLPGMALALLAYLIYPPKVVERRPPRS